jgi:type 1 glutamine amidotransferase
MLRYFALSVLLLTVAGIAAAQQQESRVLVFSKTTGFRHSSIETGIAAVQKLGRENGFAVEATEDAGAFTERNLKRFRAVVFLNTTGDVLNATQQDAFERYIQAGGGWVGIHSATDTEYDWPWYGRLAGAYFESHPNNPNVRKGTFRVLDKSHPSTEGLPDRWEREDEFYNFKSIDRDIRVLVDIDETSYQVWRTPPSLTSSTGSSKKGSCVVSRTQRTDVMSWSRQSLIGSRMHAPSSRPHDAPWPDSTIDTPIAICRLSRISCSTTRSGFDPRRASSEAPQHRPHDFPVQLANAWGGRNV